MSGAGVSGHHVAPVTVGRIWGVVLQGMRWVWVRKPHPPQVEPLSVVEEADNRADDNGALGIVGHVGEDWRDPQQYNHDREACTSHTGM